MASDSGVARPLAIVVALGVLLGGIAVGAYAIDRPSVRCVENDWGTVTEERTEVQTRITITNSRLVELTDTAVAAEYTVSLNGIQVVDGRKESVRLSGPASVIESSVWLDNSDIPRWWASHVNRGEKTTVRVNPTVETELGGYAFGVSSLTRTRTVRTDLLEPLRVDRTRQLRVRNRTVLVVNETRARWGNATVERTPLDGSATVTNPLPVAVPLTNVTYTVRMNDVVVGRGRAGTQTVVQPGATETIEADAVIDNQKLDEWWVTHRRNDGTSRLVVTFNATVEVVGERIRVPLRFLSLERTFTTDILGGDSPPRDERRAAVDPEASFGTRPS